MKKKKITKKEIRRKEKKAAKRAMRELWDKLREEVKKIQSNKCYICNEEVLGARAHCHHIISREIKSLQYDIQNLVLLCPGDHKLKALSVHKTSILFSELLRTREPERYNYLLEKIKENNLNNTKTIEINEVKKDGME